MNLCLDCLSLCQLEGTGLYTYNFELINNLLKMYPQIKYDLILYNKKNIYKWYWNKNISYSNFIRDGINNESAMLEELIGNKNIDLYHSLNNGLSMPSKNICKTIITVHDLAPLSIPIYVDDKYAKNFIGKFPSAIREADKILAVSEFIKSELISSYHDTGIESKIEVVYPGCSMIFRPLYYNQYYPMLYNKFEINGEFLLCAGSVHKRKNWDLLFELFKNIRSIKPRLKLVLAGKLDGKREENYNLLKELANKFGIADSVLFLGIVDYLDMPYLYNGALCTFNLSEYEGFPMVCVESIACGTPVVCLDTSSFREVLGENAPLIKSGDIKTLIYITLQILNNVNYRKRMVNKLRQKCAQYKWETAIQKTISVYEELLNEKENHPIIGL